MVRMGSEDMKRKAIKMSKVTSETMTQSLQTTHSQALLSFYKWRLCSCTFVHSFQRVCLSDCSLSEKSEVSTSSAHQMARWADGLRNGAKNNPCMKTTAHAHILALLEEWGDVATGRSKEQEVKKKVATGEVRRIKNKKKQNKKRGTKEQNKKKVS